MNPEFVSMIYRSELFAPAVVEPLVKLTLEFCARPHDWDIPDVHRFLDHLASGTSRKDAARFVLFWFSHSEDPDVRGLVREIVLDWIQKPKSYHLN